jgi:hypothetical protein
LRGVTKHARRLVNTDLVPANSAEISVCKERDLDAATARIDHRCSPGRRDGGFERNAGTPRHDGGFGRTARTSRRYGQSALSLVGKSETELRAMLGSPTSEEDRPPGKRWRYRDGQCTLDVQLYPDVKTKQFGTLAYEVKSDDNTDEGNRVCLAQLQSRAQTRH